MVCKDMTFASWQFRRPHQKSHLFYRDCIMSGGAVPQTKIGVEKSAALKSAVDFLTSLTFKLVLQSKAVLRVFQYLVRLEPFDCQTPRF